MGGASARRLAGRDLADHDGGTDHVGRPLLTFSPRGMSLPPYNSFRFFNDLYGVPAGVGERDDG
jgi:hypothetical protein